MAVTVTGIVTVVVTVVVTALVEVTGSATSVVSQDILHVSVVFVWVPVVWAVAGVVAVAVAVAGAQGSAGAQVMEEGATALVATLQGAAVFLLAVVVVQASHQVMIVMGEMRLLMPTMDTVVAAGARKLVESYGFVLPRSALMSSCWLVHCVM